jgi:hypothetical protein
MAKTPEQVRQSYYTNIESTTGTTIAEWMKRIRESGLTKGKEIVTWLKTEHGLRHGYASLLTYDALHPGDAVP